LVKRGDNTVKIAFNKSVTIGELTKEMSDLGGVIVSGPSALGLYAISFETSKTCLKAVEALEANTKCYAQDLPQSSYQTFTQKEESFNLPAPRLSGEARLRYQSLSRDDFLDSAEALTLRFKGRVEFDLFEKTTALVELDGNVALINNFNDGSNGRLDLPFIPDPNGFDLNRLQITTEVVPQTRVTKRLMPFALKQKFWEKAFST